jgi:small GTP-binding protein
MEKKVTLAIIGDTSAGKTCLIWAYAKQEIPAGYVPTVFDNYTCKLHIAQKNVRLGIWDTGGVVGLEDIRMLAYADTDVFLICFSVVDPRSFANVASKWVPELKKHVRHPRIILVGTQKELRGDDRTLRRLSWQGQKPVQTADGKALAAEIKAAAYLECSAAEQDGVNQVFNQALVCAIKRKKPKKNYGRFLRERKPRKSGD